MPRPFTYRRGQLACGATPLAGLARRFGTPLFLYDLDAMLAAYHAYARAFARVPHQICAAVKANGNRAVLAALARAGSGFDIVSGGGLGQGLGAGRETGAPATGAASGRGAHGRESRFVQGGHGPQSADRSQVSAGPQSGHGPQRSQTGGGPARPARGKRPARPARGKRPARPAARARSASLQTVR